MTGTTSESPTEEPANDHLDDLEDGCGCAEVWEHLSERREAEREAEREAAAGKGEAAAGQREPTASDDED